MLAPRFRSLLPAAFARGDAAAAAPARMWGVVPSARVRLVVYALAVVGVGCWVSFTRLGKGVLANDEAAFAYTTDHMRASGDWVVPRIDAKHPHLNATPLYNWLGCVTFGWFPDGDFRYRFWSGVFGVWCGLATLALGTLLFRAEVGLLAAVILLVNRQFLFNHGVRAGVMESGLVFFVLCSAICYVRTHQSQRYRLWWALFGVSLGLGVLMKPPAMAGFFAVVICAHHFVTRLDLPWKARLLGPVLGLGVAALITVPWFAALKERVGWRGPETLIIFNSIKRAASHGGGMPDRPPTFYLNDLRESSRVFGHAVSLLGVVAAGAAAAVVTGRGRLAWGLPLLLGSAYMTVISFAATKHTHYSFASYPFLSIAVAGLLLAGLGPPPLGALWARVGWRLLAVAGVVVAAGWIQKDWAVVAKTLRDPKWPYPPVAFQEAMRPQLEIGRARLILYRYTAGDEPIKWDQGFCATESYYNHFRVPRAIRPRAVGGLNRQLSDGTAAVVFLPPNMKVEQLIREGLERTPDRALMVRSDSVGYPVLLFNGVGKACDLEKVIHSTFLVELELPKPAAKEK